MNKRKINAFTLVELLIVIALIGILSVAVLATINPIEQANKARDAKFQNDAAEVLNALERYYASLSQYPWGTPGDVGVGETILSSIDEDFGVIDADGDPAGVLITTSELKSSFANKDSYDLTDTEAVDMMYIYNNGSDSNYVCYVPKAKANRTKYGDLKCLTVTEKLDPVDEDCESISETSVSWALTGNEDYYNSGYAQFLCVPEDTVSDVEPGAEPTVEPTEAL